MLDMSFPPQLIQLYCIVCTASRQPELKQPISYSTGSLVSDQERSHTGSLQSLFISIQNLCRTVNKESINNITVKYCNIKFACKPYFQNFQLTNWRHWIAANRSSITSTSFWSLVYLFWGLSGWPPFATAYKICHLCYYST